MHRLIFRPISDPHSDHCGIRRSDLQNEAERLERLAAFGGPNYDPLNKHKQEFLLVKVRAQQQFENEMAKRAEVRYSTRGPDDRCIAEYFDSSRYIIRDEYAAVACPCS